MATLTAATDQSAPMVPIRLTTRSTQFSIPATTYSVPLDWKRLHLSELLNKVLGLKDQRVPFDFLVDGQLLRASLGQTLESKGLTSETTLDIEYFQSVLPPSFQSSLPSRDWVSDVSIGRQGILSASYDGSATLWSLNSEQIAKASHDLPVLSACISQNHLISGGMDRRIQIQSLNHDSAQYSFEYHQAPVSTLRANPHAAEHASFLSGSWDGGIALWSTNPDFETKQTQSSTSSGPAKKRRKMPDTSLKGLRPVHALSPSNPTTSATVCRAIFDKTNAARAWSAGADHAVRSWDLELGIAVQSRLSDKVLLDLDQLAGGSEVFVTGSTDRTVCFWDFRQENSAISLALTGHASQVSSVSAHPTLGYQALSGSHDGTLKIWDARSPKSALFTITRPLQPREEEHARVAKLRGPDKVLTTAWDGSLVVSGGEDCKLQMHKTSNTTSTAT